MKKYEFDVIVIGGGAAGLSAAKTAKGLGKKTAIVEMNRLGGECTWTGCVPSKALIHFAETARGNAENALDYVREVVQKVYHEERPEVLEELGISVILGRAVFLDPHSITVNDKKYQADKFILAAGSEPFVPPVEGLHSVDYLTNENLFQLKKIPKSLLILGGGPIGIEMAQAFNRLGTAVTVVEMTDRILFREDAELTAILERRLREEGVILLTGTKALKFEKTSGGIVLTVEAPGKEAKSLTAESVLVAVGRQPHTENMELDKAGVKYTRRGITVNRYLQTSQPNIYACGDIVGPYYFSHVAGYQGITAGLNVSLPFRGKTSDDGVLWTTYTDPELSRFGPTEAEALEKYGKSVKIYKVPYSRLDRAKTDSREEGLAKYILNRKGRLIGAHITGKFAGELIHEAQLVRSLKIPLKRLQSVMHAYPSYSDIIRLAARDAYIEGIRNLPIVRLLSKLTMKPQEAKHEELD